MNRSKSRFHLSAASLFLEASAVYIVSLSNHYLSFAKKLDIKAFGEEDHLKVTAMPNKNTLENAVFLAKMGKLFEIRTVIVPGLFDIENTIIKAGELLRPYQSIHPVRYKLISYRPFGVREEYRTYQSPSKEYMEQLEELAYKSGFDDVVTT